MSSLKKTVKTVLKKAKKTYSDSRKKRYSEKIEKIAADYCKKFDVPDLTNEEKAEISEYWKQYGIKPDTYDYHRMYYHATGKHDPRFVPDNVAGMIVYRYYNDRAFINTWRDKNMFTRLLPEVPMPKTVVKCMRGRFILDGEYITKCEESEKTVSSRIFEKYGKPADFIFKRTRETGFGKGVKKYTVSSAEELFSAMKEWSKCNDYIIQECVKQHPAFAAFNESSVNMMRVYSWRHGNDVDVLFATVRAGVPGYVTDVSFIDGVETVRLVGIGDDGCFADKMLDQNGTVVKELPKGIKVPALDKVKDIIKKNHLLIDNFDIVGWDFTVDENENPVCFEWNIQWPGTVLYQYVNGPLWRNKTDDILAFLKDEKNRKKYIPGFLKY